MVSRNVAMAVIAALNFAAKLLRVHRHADDDDGGGLIFAGLVSGLFLAGIFAYAGFKRP